MTFLRVVPIGVQARDQHLVRRSRSEVQHDVLPSALDVLVERIHDHQRVRMAELAAPEALEVVAARVVESGKLLIGERGFAFLPQMIAGERDHVASVSLQNDRRVRHREDPMVVLVRLSSGQQRDALEGRIDLGRRDALLIERRLRLLHLQLALRIGQAFLLLE